MPCLGDLPENQLIALPEVQQPSLLVVIDTEEEFDWAAPFSRQSVQTSAMREISRGQDLFDRFGIRPTYAIDYPIAADPECVDTLRGYSDSGRASIGLHLHSWVNPPYKEELSPRNSYQGNLPSDLEFEKLDALLAKVKSAFDHQPIIHKAGRYGLGENSHFNLERLGIEIDLSLAPAFDFRQDGGPDYRHYSARPQHLGGSQSLIELPCTAGFIGPLRALGPAIYAVGAMRSASGRVLAGLLSKTRCLERIMLSPEGHSLAKLKRLTRSLLRRGHRAFTFSFHSPTLKPGCTPYTRSPQDVDQFMVKCEGYFDFFLNELQGQATTPVELRTRLIS